MKMFWFSIILVMLVASNVHGRFLTAKRILSSLESKMTQQGEAPPMPMQGTGPNVVQDPSKPFLPILEQKIEIPVPLSMPGKDASTPDANIGIPGQGLSMPGKDASTPDANMVLPGPPMGKPEMLMCACPKGPNMAMPEFHMKGQGMHKNGDSMYEQGMDMLQPEMVELGNPIVYSSVPFSAQGNGQKAQGNGQQAQVTGQQTQGVKGTLIDKFDALCTEVLTQEAETDDRLLRAVSKLLKLNEPKNGEDDVIAELIHDSCEEFKERTANEAK